MLDLIADGTFSHGDTEMFRPLVDNLRYDDPFLVLRRLRGLRGLPGAGERRMAGRRGVDKMSILNTARSGKFSSDRAIAEYCDEIWNVWPLTVTM